MKHTVSRASLCAGVLALACGGSGDSASAPAEPAPDEQPRSPGREQNIDVEAGSTAPEPPSAAPSAPDSSPPAVDANGGEPVEAPPRRCDLSLSFDDLYTAIDADLRSEDGDAPFLRYVSLSHRLNQGLCPEDLESDRLALVKAINSLSTEVGIAVPEAIDEDGIIYRIDLRDLGWNEPTEVAGVAFDDKWEAIIAASPYAVELEGDDADSAKLAAGTAVPVLFSDALIDVTVVGDLYYALVGIGNNGLDLFAELAIDFADVVRAGTRQSRMSRQDTIIQRFEQGRFQGFYWSRFDVADTSAGQSILSNPLGFQGDVIASMFTLPNGMMAFALFDAAFGRLAETDVLVDQFQRDGLMRNSISCSGCHFAGVNPVTDEVRTYVEANRLDFDADTLSDVEETFLSQPELDEVIQGDNDFYLAALARAGLDGESGDPVSSVYQRFDAEVTLAVAAGELGVTPDVLGRELVGLSNDADPVLVALRATSLRREQFEEAYLATLCALLITSDNRPLAAACDAAAQ